MKNSGDDSDALRHYIELLSRPIAFQPIFVKWTGSVNAALFLSQLVYWTSRSEDEHRWVYKTKKDWERETGLSRYEQEGARKILRNLGVLKEKLSGVPATLHFRITSKLVQLAEHSPASWGKTSQLNGEFTPNYARAHNARMRLTENTAENTHKAANAANRASSFGVDGQSSIEKLCHKFAKFSASKGYHTYDASSSKTGWSKRTIRRWQRPLEDLVEKLGGTKEIERTMDWYFEHCEDEYCPQAQTMNAFCRKYGKLRNAINRSLPPHQRHKVGPRKPGAYVNGKPVFSDED